MGKLLVHLTHGPSSPTEADRAFLITRTALEEGHDVSMFLAGAAVELMQEENLNKTLGIGETAIPLKDSVHTILEKGGRIVLSKVSCGARGMNVEELEAKGFEAGMPNVLVQLTMENDRVITYG